MLFAPVHHPFPNGRLPRSLAVAAVLVLVLGGPRAAATTSAIGGADQTSENFSATGGWQAVNMTPGCLPTGVALTGTHLLISEVAPRGAGTGARAGFKEAFPVLPRASRPKNRPHQLRLLAPCATSHTDRTSPRL